MTAERTLSRIPGEGASALPVVGAEIPINPASPPSAPFAGAQALLPIGFTSSWTGTEAALLAQIDSDPDALIDDGPRLKSAIQFALTTGHPLKLPYPVYIGSRIDITCGNPINGRRVELIVEGNGIIIGGPDIDGPLLAIRNSSSQGSTSAGTVDLVIRGLRMSSEKTPRGTLSSHDCLYISGFRRKVFTMCDLKAGAHYIDAGGDSGISANGDITIAFCRFQGFPDLGFYGLGTDAGNVFLGSVQLIGNRYFYCNNAWSAKRNMRQFSSVGELFVGCYNGATAFEATGTGDGLLSGHTVTISSPVFENPVNRCIDPRGSRNWNVKGMVVRGTIGIDRDGVTVAGAAVVCLSGSSNCSIEGVAEVTGAVSGNALVRLQNYNGVFATDNKIDIVATNSTIGNGILETGSSDRNTMCVKFGAGVTTAYTIVGAATSVTWEKDGARGYQVGSYDRSPGRRPYNPTLITASGSIGVSQVSRTIQAQPAASNINLILPSDGVNGDEISFVKAAGSGVGIAIVRDPTNTTPLARMMNIGDHVTMRYDGANWFPVTRSRADTYLPVFLTTAANIPTPPSGVKNLFIDSADGLTKTKDSSGTVAAV